MNTVIGEKKKATGSGTKKRATSIEKQNNSETDGSADKRDETAKTYSSLKDYLTQLEVENQKLAKDLEAKRAARAERLKAERADRKRNEEELAKIDKYIDRTSELARKQKVFLNQMRAFYRKNEEQLKKLGEKLATMETSMNTRGISVDSMKQELINMLGELQEMREKREKIVPPAPK